MPWWVSLFLLNYFRVNINNYYYFMVNIAVFVTTFQGEYHCFSFTILWWISLFLFNHFMVNIMVLLLVNHFMVSISINISLFQGEYQCCPPLPVLTGWVQFGESRNKLSIRDVLKMPSRWYFKTLFRYITVPMCMKEK